MTSDSTSLYFDGVASLFQMDIVEMKYKDLCNSGIIRLLERWLVKFFEKMNVFLQFCTLESE